MTNPYAAPSTKEGRVRSTTGPMPLWLRMCVGALLFTSSFAAVSGPALLLFYELVIGDTDAPWHWLIYLVPLAVSISLLTWYIRRGKKLTAGLQIGLAIGSSLVAIAVVVVFYW